MKKWWCPSFHEWSRLFFRISGFCILLTKMKAMSVVSLSFSKICYQCSFSEIFKGTKDNMSSSSSVKNWNVPSNDCYDTKHYLVRSEKPSSCKVCKKKSQRCWGSFCSFFWVFPSGLSYTFDIRINLKMKHH